MGDRLRVVIASPLEREHVAAISERADGLIDVVYRPDLLPVARYVGDHDGTVRDLTPNQVDEWRNTLLTADILFDFDWWQPADLPTTAPRVRWVQATSSGIGEFVRRTGLQDWRATMTTAAGVHAIPLAEFAVLSVLYFRKDVPELLRLQRLHQWRRHTMPQLEGQRTLVIGLGQVGQAVARALSGLGLEVWGMKRTPNGVDGVSKVIPIDGLRETLPLVDVVILTAPYTPQTHHLIGADELALMTDSTIIVNLARGPIIDESALIEALSQKRIRGAVLDVVETEPLPLGSPLWDLDNVLISSHSASTAPFENQRLVDLFLDNLRCFVAGRPLRNVFDPARSY